MKKILRTQKSAYALSLVLFLIGLAAFAVALWKTWPQITSSENPLSTFLTLLWTENLDFILGLEFKLMYLFILGDATIISGVVVWILSRQWILIPGEFVWFQCPFCKKKWRSSADKALVHCPHCRQLVHPIMVEG